jgi:hypothetical protein
MTVTCQIGDGGLIDRLTDHSQTLLHPFRPLSVHYPPGELPPKDALDELTHQIVRYAFRSSPVRRTTPVIHQPASSPPDSPSKFDLPSSVMLEECSSHGASSETSSNRPDGWTHSWDATRQKLFELALEESKFGHDAYDRKMPRAERQTRPGLRRVDSMDFLDQAEDEERPADTIGRTLRWVTRRLFSGSMHRGPGRWTDSFAGYRQACRIRRNRNCYSACLARPHVRHTPRAAERVSPKGISSLSHSGLAIRIPCSTYETHQRPLHRSHHAHSRFTPRTPTLAADAASRLDSIQLWRFSSCSAITPPAGQELHCL